MTETVTAGPAGHRHGGRLMMVLVMLLLLEVQTLMAVVTLAAATGVMR